MEGADFDIMMDINLKKFNIINVSIEYLHLTKIQKKKILNKFLENGLLPILNSSNKYFGINISPIEKHNITVPTTIKKLLHLGKNSRINAMKLAKQHKDNSGRQMRCLEKVTFKLNK